MYEFNEHGFRSPSFKTPADIRILTIGCSYVMGIGLPFQHVFHQRLADKIKASTGKTVANLSMGHGGASNDWIARMAVIAARELRPNIAIISFVQPNRREFVDNEGKIYRYWPQWDKPEQTYGNKNVYKTMDNIRNLYDDARNAWMNYTIIDNTFKANGIKWAWIHNGLPQEVLSRIDSIRCAGQWENHREPLARDNMHPGPEVSDEMAELLFNKLKELGILPAQPTTEP